MSELSKKQEYRCTCQSCGKVFCIELSTTENKCPECGSGNVKIEENIYYVDENGHALPKEEAEEILHLEDNQINRSKRWKKDVILGICLVIFGLPMLVVKFGLAFILLGVFIIISGLCEKMNKKLE